MTNRSVSRRTTLAGLGALGLSATGVTAAAASSDTPSGWGRRNKGPLIGPTRHRDLHIMAFNIRYDQEGTQPGEPDYWGDREPLVTRLVKVEQPTVLGVQEALYHQLEAIKQGLPEHRMVGYGRDGGSHGEYSSIFYDSQRLTVLEWDQFWLSDTPDVIGSATWGNNVTRIVTWARMIDRSTDEEFIAVNTHFDHESEQARLNSARMIVDLAQEHADTPLVVTGDFNANAGDSAAYTTMVESGVFVDTWEAARKQLTPAYGTFPNYQDSVVGGDRIDWVLTSPGTTVRKAAINTATYRGRWPSDHTPVQALIRID